MLEPALPAVDLDCVSEAPQKWPTLDADLKGFKAPSGAGLDGLSRRRHVRRPLRGRAALENAKLAPGERLGVYTLDISPMGLGLICPVQLFPSERVAVDLMIDDARRLELQIRRCRRLQEGSYICGGTFIGGPFSPAQFVALLRGLS